MYFYDLIQQKMLQISVRIPHGPKRKFLKVRIFPNMYSYSRNVYGISLAPLGISYWGTHDKSPGFWDGCCYLSLIQALCASTNKRGHCMAYHAW